MSAIALYPAPAGFSGLRSGGGIPLPTTARRLWPYAVMRAALVALVLLSPLTMALFEPLVWAGLACLLAMIAAVFVVLTGDNRSVLPAGRSGAAVLALLTLTALPFLSSTLAGAAFPRETAPVALAIVAAALFLGLTCHSANSHRARDLMTAWLFAGAVIVAAASVLGGRAGPPGHPGLTGPFANHNALALYLGLGMMAGLGLRLSDPAGDLAPPLARRLTGLVHWLGIGLIGLALLASLSRVGAAAALAGLACLTALAPRGRRRAPARALVVSTLLGAFAAPALIDRFFRLGPDIDGRRELYAQVVDLIRNAPVLGYGPGHFARAFEAVEHPPVDPGRVWAHAHSSVLNALVELGPLVGALPFLAALVVFVRLTRRALRHSDARAATAAAALVLAGCHAVTDFSLENPPDTLVLLMLVGIGLSAGPPKKGA